jgi:hypothetical protein
MKPTPGLRPGFATLAPLRRIRAFGAMHLGGAAYLAARYAASLASEKHLIGE